MSSDMCESIADHFWSKVWRCTHRHPCKKCCWPWVQEHGLYCFQTGEPAIFQDKRLWPKPSMMAARMAYFLKTGNQLFPSRFIHLCHQCDYKSCCNPSHLIPGSPADNRKDLGRRPLRSRKGIILPDSRVLPYALVYLQGPCRATPSRSWGGNVQYIFCLYANDYEGKRGYPLTDGLCMVVEPRYMAHKNRPMPRKEHHVFLQGLIQSVSHIAPYIRNQHATGVN
jgi:hypothetical protein